VTIIAPVTAAILAIAVFGKLRAREYAHGLVIVEGLLVIWLLSGRAQQAALACAALLFGTFAGVLAVRRLRGRRRTSCSCFGAAKLRSTTFLAVRAGALAAFAALGAADPPLPGERTAVIAALAALAMAVAALAVLVAALYRQVGILHARIGPRRPLEIAEEGPPLGSAAPPLAGLQEEGSVLVAFLGVGCRICIDLEPALRRLGDDELGVRVVYDVESPETLEAWNVPGTPFLVHVADGVVRSKGLVNTVEEIDALLEIGYAREAHAAR
jgi:hypothetical protein